MKNHLFSTKTFTLGMSKNISIIIADGTPLFRIGLRNEMSQLKNVNNIYEAENYKVLISKIRKYKPDFAFICMELLEFDWRESLKTVFMEFPYIKIVILSSIVDETSIIHLIQIGIHGYLMKNTNIMEVEEAVHGIIENGFYYNSVVNRAMRKKLTSQIKDKGLLMEWGLNGREKQVLNLICKEYTSREIAEKLSISQKTVEKVRHNLLGKTGSKNIIGLVKFAISKNKPELI